MVRELQVFRWVRSRNIHISRLPCTCSAHETRLRSAIVVRNITTGDHVQGGFNVAPPVDMDLRPVRRRETPITADLPPTDKQHLRMPWGARGALESWMFQSSLFSSDAGTLEWTLPYFLGSIFMITAKRNQRLAHTVYTIVVQSLLPLGVPLFYVCPSVIVHPKCTSQGVSSALDDSPLDSWHVAASRLAPYAPREPGKLRASWRFG
jgi:hypothetical protein